MCASEPCTRVMSVQGMSASACAWNCKYVKSFPTVLLGYFSILALQESQGCRVQVQASQHSSSSVPSQCCWLALPACRELTLLCAFKLKTLLFDMLMARPLAACASVIHLLAPHDMCGEADHLSPKRVAPCSDQPTLSPPTGSLLDNVCSSCSA